MANNEYSWASEVEKEHEATGWTGWEPGEQNASTSALLAHNTVVRKPKGSKKKKRKNNQGAPPEGPQCKEASRPVAPQQTVVTPVASAWKGQHPLLETVQQTVVTAVAPAWKGQQTLLETRKNDTRKDLPDCTRKDDTRSIMTKLLPDEKGGVLQSTKSGNAMVGQRVERVFLPVEPYDEDDRLCSDSACSDTDLGDDSDCMESDGCDSDASEKSLETRKKNKMLRVFFETLGSYTNDQLNDNDRQWHCPACQGGKGAIDWYKGLQPLIAHAKTHRKRRLKLHQEFAEVLEEDLEMRRAGRGFVETKFGKWKGLREDNEATNPLIVWPPMVVIQNTRLDQDEQDKWIGMGNKELLEMFQDYSPMKARHSYGPRGHRGLSLIVFADSPTGYLNAERLAKDFKDGRRGKEHWEHPGKVIFHPGGDRILYGYMATAEEMEIFNRHSAGKSKVKWELKRYQEAVVHMMKQMDMDNRDLHRMKVKVQKEKEHSKTLEKTVSMFTRKLEFREKEIFVIRQRAKEQHEENQREMDELERTYKERVSHLSKDTARKEEEIQKEQEDFKQEQMERCQQLEKKLGEDHQQQQQAKVQEEIAKIVESTYQDSEEYEAQKRELMKKHHLRKLKFMRDQYEQALRFERELERERAELLDKYRLQRELASLQVE